MRAGSRSHRAAGIRQRASGSGSVRERQQRHLRPDPLMTSGRPLQMLMKAGLLTADHRGPKIAKGPTDPLSQ